MSAITQGQIMIRTYKRKLILNKAQEERLNSWLGATRLVYNMGMGIRNDTYKATGGNVHKYALSKQVTEARGETEWLNDVPFECFVVVLDRLDNAYKTFFRTFKSGGGYPKFATKHRWKSIGFKYHIHVNGNRIKLPKIGWLKTVKDAPVFGIIKSAKIVKEPTGYFSCIQCDHVPAKFNSDSQAVGIDMGLSHFAVDSNGQFIDNPRHFKRYERQLRIENRSLARKRKGSKSWLKQAKNLSRLHHKISNVRKDFLHKETTKIAKANATVCLEDLNISGMTRNKRLSGHIMDAGWGMFKTMLQYKTNVILVNPRHTSQECSQCGYTDAGNRKTQSEFSCLSCSYKANADYNAALNILRKGIPEGRERSLLGQALTL